ncbi:SDR family NAD(P)-dependent oxidoreductase [Salibacteraceae bacterium]|nr:SDR family NAD(P)-dependent oxidoreductase [Salibacteraceae bacterium]
MIKTILVTGATSGFGKSIAEKFAKNSHRLIITGRRESRLNEIASSLKNSFGVDVLPLCFDVRDRLATEIAIKSLNPEWECIDILVNNAGLASGLEHINNGDHEDWDKMIDTNIKGLLNVSKPVINLMVERKSGHIINIGSTAGKEVYERGNIYCATKHAVDAISKGMRIDLLKHNIKVTQISPGAAETEFSLVRFHGDEKRAKDAYKGYKPMTPQDISELVFYSTTLPPHLCINDLVVTSTSQANSFYIDRNN